MKNISRQILLAFSALILMIYLFALISYISNANNNERTISYSGNIVTFVYDNPLYQIEFMFIFLLVTMIILIGITIYLLIKKKYKYAKIFGIITYTILIITSLIAVHIFQALLFLLVIGMFIGNKKSKSTK